MSMPNSPTPIRVVEAMTGADLAQAADLWLRSPRGDEAWQANQPRRVFLAFIGDEPVAVAQARASQFGTVGLDHFRALPGTETERLRERLTDFLRASLRTRRSTRPLAAAAA